MRADGRTDVTKLVAAFRNFANAPENEMAFTDTLHVVLQRKVTVEPVVTLRGGEERGGANYLYLFMYKN